VFNARDALPLTEFAVPLNVPPPAGNRGPLGLLACRKYASTCRCRIVRHPVCAAVGYTHADSVIAVVKLSELDALTVTTSFTPSNVSALPYRPAVVHVAPEIVPVLPFPEVSAVVVPVPSLKPHAATRPAGVAGVYVTASVSWAVLPAASRAVTVTMFTPCWSAILDAVQFDVPEAIPLPPRSLTHVTCVTPTLSLAVPPMLSGVAVTVKVGFELGVVIVTVGWVVSDGVVDDVVGGV
jgi:hypothetical protein